jgi:hypothetical protein
MRQFAFVGLGSFAMSMLERIAEITDQIIAVDDDPTRIEHVKEMVSTAFTMDFSMRVHLSACSMIRWTGRRRYRVEWRAILLVTFRLKKLGSPKSS